MSWPSGTSAVSGATIESAKYNAFLADLLSDLNTARPIAVGGTGATTAADARTNLGVSASDATITAIAALDFSTAGSMMYSTAADTFSLVTSTAAGRTALTYVDPNADRILFWDDSAGAFTSLSLDTGLSITNTTMSLHTNLAAIAGLTATDNGVIIGNGSAFVVESGASLKTSLGLTIGTDVQAYDAGLAALAAFNTNGILCQTADNTFAGRTLTGTAAEITVTNGDGVSGAPTFSLPTALTFTGKTVTGGTFSGPTLSGTVAGSPTASGAWTFSGNPVTAGGTNAGGSAQAFRGFNTSGASNSIVDISLDPGNNGFNSRDALLRATNNGSNQITFSILVANAGAPATGFTLNPDLTFAFAGASGTIGGSAILTAAGLAANVAAWLADPTSAKLAAAVTNETGSGALVFGTSPTLTTPTIDGGNANLRLQVSAETSGTLSAASANKIVLCAGDITLDDGIFTAPDCILFDPGASNRTFTRAAGCTMYVNGVDSATATLALRQMGSAYWRTSAVVVLSGAFS